jgi:hypothetical protein
MAYNEKSAKKIMKMALQMGVEQTAIEMGISQESVHRAIRMAKRINAPIEETNALVEALGGENAPVLIISDTHIPYNNPDMIPFLQWVHKSKGCRDRVVHIGDLMDFHSMSFHKTEPDALSPEEEYQRAKDIVAELCEAFPCGELIEGNHDKIGKRKMVDATLAPSMLKENNALYGLPDGWNVHELYYVIPEWDVLCEHGMGSAGKMGCLNTAILKRCSYCQGHSHSAAAVMYSSNYNSTIFGLNVGWLGDEGSLAVRYAKYFTKKGVLGCGVVYSGSYAEFVPMSAWPGYKGEL